MPSWCPYTNPMEGPCEAQICTSAFSLVHDAIPSHKSACNHGHKSKLITIRPSPHHSRVVTGAHTVPHNSPTYPQRVGTKRLETHRWLGEM